MHIRFSVAAFLLTGVCTTFALHQAEASKLPIYVPKHAVVGFEAEGTGKQILKTVRALLNGDMTDPTAPSVDKITIKTGLGNVDLRLEDLAPIFEKINQLHVVSYTALPNEDPFSHYEKQFVSAGMSRVTLIPGSEGALIMRSNGSPDQYALVVRQKENIVVLRSEGSPDIRSIGRALFEALSRAIQEAVKARRHSG
jgi:hypothetical protein